MLVHEPFSGKHVGKVARGADTPHDEQGMQKKKCNQNQSTPGDRTTYLGQKTSKLQYGKKGGIMFGDTSVPSNPAEATFDCYKWWYREPCGRLPRK